MCDDVSKETRVRHTGDAKMFRFVRRIREIFEHGESQELSRLEAMRRARETKCVCAKCQDLLSRIHFDGALIKHAHKCEGDGIGFWTDSLLPIYQPDLRLESTDGCDSIEFSDEFASIYRVMTAPKKGSDTFWEQHYRDMMRCVESWHKRDDRENAEFR